MKKWSIWLTSTLVAVLMIAGMCAIAAEYGSRSDPLVTLSYIEEVLLPSAKKDVDRALEDSLEDYEKVLKKQTEDMEKHIDKKLKDFSAGEVDEELVDAIAGAVIEQTTGNISVGSASWTTVEIPAGYTLLLDVGAQVILRQGQAVCTSDGAPGLLDLSNGNTLSNGGTVEANHLYCAGDRGLGVVSIQGCTAMVSGTYSFR